MVRVRWLTSLAAAFMLALLGACGAEPSPTSPPVAVTATAAPTGVAVQPTGGNPVATVVAGIAATPTAPPEVDITPMGSKTLFILHTNDVVGYTDPCG